jgi:hypothetical protein
MFFSMSECLGRLRSGWIEVSSAGDGGGAWRDERRSSDHQGGAPGQDRGHPGACSGPLPGGAGRTAGRGRDARHPGHALPGSGRTRRGAAARGRWIAGVRTARRAGRTRIAPWRGARRGRGGGTPRDRGGGSGNQAGTDRGRTARLGGGQREPGGAPHSGRRRTVLRLGDRPRGLALDPRHRRRGRHGPGHRQGADGRQRRRDGAAQAGRAAFGTGATRSRRSRDRPQRSQALRHRRSQRTGT